jgi:hypothetical protein
MDDAAKDPARHDPATKLKALSFAGTGLNIQVLYQAVSILVKHTKRMISGGRVDAHLVYAPGIAYPSIVQMPEQKGTGFAVHDFHNELTGAAVEFSGYIQTVGISGI